MFALTHVLSVIPPLVLGAYPVTPFVSPLNTHWAVSVDALRVEQESVFVARVP